jgi:hypothetical protein
MWQVMTPHSQCDRSRHFTNSQCYRSWQLTNSQCDRSCHFTCSQCNRSWHFTNPLPAVNNIFVPEYCVTVAVCEVLTAELFVLTVDCCVGGECDTLQHAATVTHCYRELQWWSSQQYVRSVVTCLSTELCTVPHQSGHTFNAEQCTVPH